jgi:transposase-like protein
MSDALSVDGYEPKRIEWQKLWQDWSPALRKRRFSDAQKREAALQSLVARDPTESERAAVLRKFPKGSRANLRRWRKRYKEFGFDGRGLARSRRATNAPGGRDGDLYALNQANPNVDVVIASVATTHIRPAKRSSNQSYEPTPGTSWSVSGAVVCNERLNWRREACEAALVELAARLAVAVGVAGRSRYPRTCHLSILSDRDDYGRFLLLASGMQSADDARSRHASVEDRQLA